MFIYLSTSTFFFFLQMFSKEWDRIVSISKEKKKEAGTIKSYGTVEKFSSKFTKRSSVMPVLLLMVIFLFQQLSGTYPIIFYAVQVFQSIGGQFGAGLDADSATIILGIIRFATSLLTAGLSRSFGRRPLLMVSGVGMTISAFIAALYFDSSDVFISVFNKNSTNILSNITLTSNISTSSFEPTVSVPLSSDLDSVSYSNTVGLFCILMFVTMSSVGFLVIPWTLIGEILPVSIRGVGGGLLVSYAYILMFVVVKFFPFILDAFHISGCFYFFSFTSLLNVVIVYFFLPETLGKSFEEIEKWFSKW